MAGFLHFFSLIHFLEMRNLAPIIHRSGPVYRIWSVKTIRLGIPRPRPLAELRRKRLVPVTAFHIFFKKACK
jgi:hypothetical protein